MPKDSDAANNKKPTDWLCNPGEFIVQKEPFKVRFKLHMFQH